MKRIRAEYLIAGAGLAGSVAGYLLKRAGADVLALEILDAKTKDKLCGGMMEAVVIDRLGQMFGSDMMDALRPVPVPELCERYAGRELRVPIMLHYALPRKRLDDYCLARYLEAGGRLLDRTAIRELDDSAGIAVCHDLRTGEPIEAEFERIIGADGAMSAVRRLLTGRKQRVGIALEGVVPLTGKDATFEFLYGNTGYRWYIPQGDEAVAGCGTFSGDAEVCRNGLAAFCKELGIEAPRTVRGAAIPTGDDILLEYGRRTFFAGDAAGMVEGLTGAGIRQAVFSARLLAQSLLEGQSYTEIMRPDTEFITDTATDIRKQQFRRCFFIMRKGEPVEGNVILTGEKL
ncbi:MAG: NAD(P)/FAD-dependent oxidoreductase [Succiniclasticum sp.]